MKKVSAFCILLAVFLTVSCASHPASESPDYETIPFIILDQHSEIVLTDSFVVLQVENIDDPSALIKGNTKSFFEKVFVFVADKSLIWPYNVQGYMTYSGQTDDICITGLKWQMKGITTVLTASCGDIYMWDENKNGFLYAFSSHFTGRQYHYTNSMHLKNRNCIVDEEKQVLGWIENDSFRICLTLSPEERTDVICCMSLLEMYWHFIE